MSAEHTVFVHTYNTFKTIKEWDGRVWAEKWQESGQAWSAW